MRIDWGNFRVIADVATEITGQVVTVDQVVLSLWRQRKYRVKVLKPSLHCARTHVINRQMSNQVARWAHRAIGPDHLLSDSYPLFAAIVRARGVKPWCWRFYQKCALGPSPSLHWKSL